MRDAFFHALTEAAAEDDRIWALTGDLGIGLFDEFERVAPGRYLNVGIAEQALVGVAAGLAYAGRRPVAYSISPFLTARAHEQVRVDVARSGASVLLVGVGGGVAYGYLGATHHATEDLAIMRALPGMTVLAPADPAEVRRATHAALGHDGPVYLRLGKNGEPCLLPTDDTTFEIGRARVLIEGTDVTLISTGSILAQTLGAAERLTAAGISPTVVHVATLKPLDVETVLRTAASGLVVTVEEHTTIGGLGSAVAEVLAEHAAAARLVRLGLPDVVDHTVGGQEFLLARHGLDAESIARHVRDLVVVPPVRRVA